MKKLKKLSLDSMMLEIPVLDNSSLKSIIGGYDDDCFWRCIAYINSGGSSYSESDAEKYADSYYGAEAGLYYYGAATSNSNMKEYIGSNYSSSSSFNIIQFDPKLAGFSGSGSMTHMVVPATGGKNYYDNNGNITHITVFDPQQKVTYSIPVASMLDILGPSGSGNSGSGYYGSGSSGSGYYGSGSSGSGYYGSGYGSYY